MLPFTTNLSFNKKHALSPPPPKKTKKKKNQSILSCTCIIIFHWMHEGKKDSTDQKTSTDLKTNDLYSGLPCMFHMSLNIYSFIKYTCADLSFSTGKGKKEREIGYYKLLILIFIFSILEVMQQITAFFSTNYIFLLILIIFIS